MSNNRYIVWDENDIPELGPGRYFVNIESSDTEMLDWVREQGIACWHDPLPDDDIDQYAMNVDRKTLMLIKLVWGGAA